MLIETVFGVSWAFFFLKSFTKTEIKSASGTGSVASPGCIHKYFGCHYGDVYQC